MICEECPLIGNVIVPYRFGTKQEIAFIGESPGYQEIEKGKPFIGPSGNILQRCIKGAGLKKSEMNILNSAKCLINKKEMSTAQIKDTLATCRPYLVKALRKIQPKLIVLLGDFALKQVMKKSGITKAREEGLKWSEEFKCWVLPTFHPAYILRNPPLEAHLLDDIKFVKKLKDRSFEPEPKDKQAINWRFANSIRSLLDKAKGKIIRVGFDTETQDMNPWNPNCVLLSYSVAPTNHSGYQVILHERCQPEEADFFVETNKIDSKGAKLKVPVRRAKHFKRKIRELKELLENPNIKLYMQNGNFDLTQVFMLFDRLGLDRPNVQGYVMDIQAAAQVYEENLFRQAALGSLQRSFSQRETDWKYQAGQTLDKTNMILADRKIMGAYAVEDACVTREVGMALAKKLKEHPVIARYFSRLVMPVISKALLTLTLNGALIDSSALPRVKRELQRATERAHEKALETIPLSVLARHDGKLRLTRQRLVIDALFSEDGFGLTVLKKTPGGNPSTNKEAMALLKDKTKSIPALRFLRAFENWSEWNSLLSQSYSQIVKFRQPDGRVHSTFSLTVAVTGRISSSRPNTANTPKRGKQAKLIRALYCAPEDCTLLEVDYSQSEIRWLAHVSEDKELLRVYRNDEDIHLNTAKALYPGAWDHMNEEERKHARLLAKSCNFGIIYGVSPWGFKKYVMTEFKMPISIDKAVESINIFNATYPGLVDYQNRAVAFCQEHSYISSPLGRRRHLPQINSDAPYRKYDNDPDHEMNRAERDARYIAAEAQRQAINSPIQGASSDTALLSLVEILEDEVFKRLDAKPILFVHDSLVFEVRKNQAKKAARVIKRIMENPPLDRFGIEFKVPLKVDIKSGPNLADMKSLDLG